MGEQQTDRADRDTSVQIGESRQLYLWFRCCSRSVELPDWEQREALENAHRHRRLAGAAR